MPQINEFSWLWTCLFFLMLYSIINLNMFYFNLKSLYIKVLVLKKFEFNFFI